jgi:hypothetical protein
MKTLHEGSTTEIGIVEAVLLIAGKLVTDKEGKRITKGKVIPTEVQSNKLLWYEQRAYRSPVYVTKYLLTLDNLPRMLCKWYPVKFYYDVRYNYARIECLSQDFDKIKFMIEEQGYNIVKMENPEEAERIYQLLPNGLFGSLKKKEVENGKAI